MHKEAIETVTEFAYLGATFTNELNASKEIRRLAIARNAI